MTVKPCHEIVLALPDVNTFNFRSSSGRPSYIILCPREVAEQMKLTTMSLSPNRGGAKLVISVHSGAPHTSPGLMCLKVVMSLFLSYFEVFGPHLLWPCPSVGPCCWPCGLDDDGDGDDVMVMVLARRCGDGGLKLV